MQWFQSLLLCRHHATYFMELRRQLEGAGPAGCVLTATAVMEHSTPAALVNHMMTWHHKACGSGGGAARGGRDKKKILLGGQSEGSPRRHVADGNGNGRDPARATLILLLMLFVILLVMCVTLAVALYLQMQRDASEARGREMLLEMGGGCGEDGSMPTCAHRG